MSLSVQHQKTFDNELIYPASPVFEWDTGEDDDSDLVAEIFEVPGGASDTPIPLQTVSNTQFSYIGSLSTGENLSVKINGATGAENNRVLKDDILLSQAITSLTASNSDATNAKKLIIIRGKA